MPLNWYGNAQSAHTAPRTHNGAQWEHAVGGMRSTVRAIYGSTDKASEDHTNSVLCKALDVAKAAALHTVRHYDGPEYKPNVYRYAPSNGPIAERTTPEVPTTVEPSAQDVAWLTRRATARKMTLVEYCAAIGIPLD